MAAEPPFVVVLDRSDALVRSLAKAVDSLSEPADVHLFTKAAEVQELFDAGPIDVLLVGPSEMTPTGLRRVARWHAAHPSTVVIVAGERDALPDPVLLMRAGAGSLLKLPATPAAVRRVLVAALDVAARQRSELATEVEVPAPRPALEELDDDLDDEVDLEVAEVVEPEPELPREPAVTITVASATGGCGKTFLATNLAYLLARGTGRTVAMVDLDLQFGEVVPTLRLKPTHTIADAVVDEDGWVDVAPLMTSHQGGFDVLAAPPDPVAADALTPALVAAVLASLRATYDYVLIDTPPSLNEVVLGSFDVSDHLLVLATLDVPSVRNMRVFLSTLERLRIPQDGLHLVLNKAEKNVELTPADIQNLLGRKWELELPYDRAVSRAVNLGLPVSEAAPRCEVSRRLVAGVPALVPGAELDLPAAPPSDGLLHKLLSALKPRTPPVAEEKTS